MFTRYKPNTHDLYVLRKLTNSVDCRLIQVFPLDNADNKRLFKLLKKAYVEARYKPNYMITHDELTQLYQQVEELKKIGDLICQEKNEAPRGKPRGIRRGAIAQLLDLSPVH